MGFSEGKEDEGADTQASAHKKIIHVVNDDAKQIFSLVRLFLWS
jgi:hypothetical protein